MVTSDSRPIRDSWKWTTCTTVSCCGEAARNLDIDLECGNRNAPIQLDLDYDNFRAVMCDEVIFSDTAFPPSGSPTSSRRPRTRSWSWRTTCRLRQRRPFWNWQPAVNRAPPGRPRQQPPPSSTPTPSAASVLWRMLRSCSAHSISPGTSGRSSCTPTTGRSSSASTSVRPASQAQPVPARLSLRCTGLRTWPVPTRVPVCC